MVPPYVRKEKLVVGLIATSVFWLWFNIVLLLSKISPLIELDIPRTFIEDQAQYMHESQRRSTRSRQRRKKDRDYANTTFVIPYEYYPDLVVTNLGDLGKPAERPPRLGILSNTSLKKHSFDSVLSDRISLNRRLEDVRGESCIAKEHTYIDLPTTSVIICFHNEATSALFRTVHSVINKTPLALLRDVILVDDASTKGESRTQLEAYIEKLNALLPNTQTITLLYNKKREGIVRSRLKGAQVAKGKVLTFLDSHCEVTKGWIEPLLSRIKENRKNVPCPVIEVIDSLDFSYKAALMKDIKQVGSFTWDLFFVWKDIPPEQLQSRKDETQPLRSPTMAGGLFAIDKSYFYQIGSYDDKMEIWGGENLDLSFRVWMCGGNLEIVPCSRVGHIFRKYNSPYSFPNGVSVTLAKNFKRVADVWMDEYKSIYYRRNAATLANLDIGDINPRVLLRRSLKCQSFKWYIDNIVFDLVGADPYPPAYGEIRLNGTDQCLDSLGKREKFSKLELYPCHGLGGNQFFVLSRKSEIIHNDEVCLDKNEVKNSEGKQEYHVVVTPCHKDEERQRWTHDHATGQLLHRSTQKCMAPGTSGNLILETCDLSKPSQVWTFGGYNDTVPILS